MSWQAGSWCVYQHGCSKVLNNDKASVTSRIIITDDGIKDKHIAITHAIKHLIGGESNNKMEEKKEKLC